MVLSAKLLIIKFMEKKNTKFSLRYQLILERFLFYIVPIYWWWSLSLRHLIGHSLASFLSRKLFFSNKKTKGKKKTKIRCSALVVICFMISKQKTIDSVTNCYLLWPRTEETKKPKTQKKEGNLYIAMHGSLPGRWTDKKKQTAEL